MSVNQADFSIAAMARVLDASESGYHAWRQRAPSARSLSDGMLLKSIRTVHAGSRDTYGARRPSGARPTTRPQTHRPVDAFGRSCRC